MVLDILRFRLICLGPPYDMEGSSEYMDGYADAVGSEKFFLEELIEKLKQTSKKKQS